MNSTTTGTGAAAINREWRLELAAQRILIISGQFWFMAAVAGQWIFAYYVAVLYGGSAIRGDLSVWTKVLPHGIVAGETMNNIAMAGHLFLAVIITLAGPLQFVAQIRSRFPKFHRWNGKMYMVLVCITSIFGLYMVWTRGTVGDLTQHLGISGDALLIVSFAIIAWRYALARNFKTHSRWVLRLFMVVSAVWFFRVGLMFWIFINGGPVGFDPESFTGPFLSFWTFGQYLLPLAALEFYFLAQDNTSPAQRLITASGIFILTFAMILGTFTATMGMWLPKL